MITTLHTEWTIGDICKGFQYNELEGKGLFGMNGKLTIQPEYQRNYLYAIEKKEAAVVESVMNGYPLGLIYFNKIGEDKYEVLDGQQRITSLGRYIEGKFDIQDGDGNIKSFDGLSPEEKKAFNEYPLTIYVCEGTEAEIKKWFKIINIVGIPLNDQELRNAVYSGPFVTAAKEVFSNSGNANVQKWSHYVSGNVMRQEYLERALEWVSGSEKESIDAYMSKHRFDTEIKLLKTYFDTVIDWVSKVFIDTDSSMRGREWGRLYEEYHKNAYDPDEVSAKVKELLADENVDNKGIYEYILGGCEDTKLLNIRIFDEKTKKAAYTKQTTDAKAKGISNCPLCALSDIDSQKTKMWQINEMDADHVTAWSKGGATDISNCQMLCKTHNRAKGNK
jgi:hypothetical protein